MVYAAGNREKLVVQRRRYACVYKRIAETNVTFHGKGGMTERMTDFLHKKSEWSIVHSDVVRVMGQVRFAPFLLADPKAQPFGTRLHNKKLKNLPPATFFIRFLPS